jgi:mannan endo-1,4-beta-mannosidase
LVSQIAYVAGLIWQNSTGFKGLNLWWSKASPTAAWLPTSGTATSPLPTSVTPPPPPPVTTGRPAANTGVGFYTSGNKIYDANGVQFLFRGLNLNFSNGNPQFEGGNPSAKPPVLPGFMISGANSVRSLVYGASTAATITAQLQQIVTAKQVPILCMYTTPQGTKTSGDSNPATITDAVAYWVSIASTLKQFEKYMFLNIANEWGPTNNPGPSNTVWATTYQAAIKTIRAAGINCTLVIDAQGFGQDFAQLEAAGASIVAADPQQNTVISLHMYGNATPTTYVQTIGAMAAQAFPVIIGEFANASPPAGTNTGNPSPTQVTEQQILAATLAAGLGCLAWAWDNNNLAKGESNDAGFSMTTGLGGINGPGNYTGNPAELTAYGTAMVADWKVNAKAATIF